MSITTLILALTQLLPQIGVRDRGVFQEYAPRVAIRIPANVSNETTSIVVNKKKRVLILYSGDVPVKIYPVAFGFNPRGHKKKQGDGRTPEGSYTIVEMRAKNLPSKYGARSLLLSYPNARDAQRGLARGLISRRQAETIRAQIAAGKIPLQNTKLGSSIRIHGGGVQGDWTLGCVAMRDADVIELYRHIRVGTRVRIVSDSTRGDRDGDGIPDQLDILIGANKLVLNAALYGGTPYIRIPFPMGDVPKKRGVCTDVVIRALRNAGYDLQSILNRHIRANRRLYPWVKRPDPNIDQRRVKNLIVLFKAKYALINRGINAKNRHTLYPGDIVFMDTLPKSGPDHIGIVSDRRGPNGYPLVINNWTTGYRTSAMELLPQIPITHHFRIR
ncbi:MAG: DUF1287 domain-containing protein [Myxococcales bacterium]|nr:DUF1287 domain-containing protein [Myxococcales bacterium]